MTIDRKTLVLALGGLLAVAAIIASPVSATNPQFHSAVAHTIFKGSQEVRVSWSFNSGTLHCTTVSIDGTVSSKTPAAIAVNEKYSGCLFTSVALETLEATVDMNECVFEFTPTGQVHIGCPSAPIRITVPLCTVTIHPQTVEKVDYRNVGTGAKESVTVTSTATGLAYTQSSLCPGGGGGSFNNGSSSGSFSTVCYDTVGNPVACWWTTQ